MTTEILECGHPESEHSSFTRGYGTDEHGKRHCYACCAERDRASMIETGKATLYLTVESESRDGFGGKVTNWPGSLVFRTGRVHKGRHNIAGTRYDAWFKGPDGKEWHAVQYGDNTQIAHCKRVKGR